jgi:protein required for attachment to host cells
VSNGASSLESIGRERSLHDSFGMNEAVILVADGGRARFLTVAPPSPFERRPKVLEAQCLIAPSATLEDGELFNTTKPGVRHRPARPGQGRGLQMSDDRRVGHRAEEEKRFADRVIEEFCSFVREHPGRRTVLVAGPPFLGALRKSLSRSPLPQAPHEWDRDLGKLEPLEVYEHLVEADVLRALK